MPEAAGVFLFAMRMIVTGGGTGGHLFPGIAVAEAMLERFPQGEIMFIGTNRHIDSRALADKAFQVVSLESRGLKGKSVPEQIGALLQVPFSVVRAAAIIRRFRPALVFGVGGYVTGPVLLAAKILGIRTCIHEQNSVPGLANRLLGRIVDRVFVSIPGSESYFAARKTVLSGNPVRREILAAGRDRAVEKERGRTLLVLGGSQGAHRLNVLVVEALASLAGTSAGEVRVIHQTGGQDAEWVRKEYERLGVDAVVAPFFADMAQRYRAADLIVSRAGATTLAEITVLHKPVILVPFPHAADNHQEKNGRFLVAGGAARMFLERELSGERLAREIGSLLDDPAMLHRLAENLKKLAKPQATETIVRECTALAAA